MIEQALERIRKELNIKYEYDHFDSEPVMPYITYERPESKNYYADGKVFFAIGIVELLLHTSKRQRMLEAKIQKILAEFLFTWEKSATWDEEEKMFIVTYTMQERVTEGEE